MTHSAGRLRSLSLLASVSLSIAIGMLALAGPAAATHAHPASAVSLSTDLVEVAKQCGTPGNPANGQHAPPLATGACVPDQVAARSGVHIGPAGTGHVDVKVAPPAPPCTGGPVTAVDICLSIQATDMQTSAGLPFDPTPGAPGNDIAGIASVRVWDHNNCVPSPCSGPYVSTGATTDIDFGPVPSDCEVGGPGTGSTCSVNTSANAVVPGTVVPGVQANIQIFRIRIIEPGSPRPNLLLQQGVFVP